MGDSNKPLELKKRYHCMMAQNMAETMHIEGMDFLHIPKGQFVMGSKDDNELAWDDEKPQHMLDIPYDYWVARFPVSNADFGAFIRATAYVTRAEREGWCWVWNVQDARWEKVQGAYWEQPLGAGRGFEAEDQYPAVQVCWYDALAFCEWLNHQGHKHELREGYGFRLPNEAEWEKAARGPNGNEWPWDDAFDPALCNCREGGKSQIIKIGACSPQGDSEYGVADMSGNIWEWTVTLWGDNRDRPTFVYPYSGNDGREDFSAGEAFYRIIRGGSFKDDKQGVRSACRDFEPPTVANGILSFRVCRALAEKGGE